MINIKDELPPKGLYVKTLDKDNTERILKRCRCKNENCLDYLDELGFTVLVDIVLWDYIAKEESLNAKFDLDLFQLF